LSFVSLSFTLQGLKEDKYGPKEESIPDGKTGQDEEEKRSESEQRLSRELRVILKSIILI